VMLCMCWDTQEAMEANGEASGQCGTTGAARMAHEAGVKQLVLTHMGPHVASPDVLAHAFNDVRKVYDGRIVFAEELTVLDV
jgi:ribonuclease BN (tRNA processing enzyme)